MMIILFYSLRGTHYKDDRGELLVLSNPIISLLSKIVNQWVFFFGVCGNRKHFSNKNIEARCLEMVQGQHQYTITKICIVFTPFFIIEKKREILFKTKKVREVLKNEEQYGGSGATNQE